MSTINLNIDQLILHGFSRRDAFYISRALQQELTRLIEVSGLPPGFSNEQQFCRMDVGDFKITEGARPEVVGRQIAGRVYSGLRPTQKKA